MPDAGDELGVKTEQELIKALKWVIKNRPDLHPIEWIKNRRDERRAQRYEEHYDNDYERDNEKQYSQQPSDRHDEVIEEQYDISYEDFGVSESAVFSVETVVWDEQCDLVADALADNDIAHYRYIDSDTKTAYFGISPENAQAVQQLFDNKLFKINGLNEDRTTFGAGFEDYRLYDPACVCEAFQAPKSAAAVFDQSTQAQAQVYEFTIDNAAESEIAKSTLEELECDFAAITDEETQQTTFTLLADDLGNVCEEYSIDDVSQIVSSNVAAYRAQNAKTKNPRNPLPDRQRAQFKNPHSYNHVNELKTANAALEQARAKEQAKARAKDTHTHERSKSQGRSK